MTVSTSTPYNIREKQEKNAAYRSLIRAELADELYEKILTFPNYTWLEAMLKENKATMNLH